MSFTKERRFSISSNFNYYLRILMNVEQIEKKEITVNISKTEIKHLIHFFGFLRIKNVLVFENKKIFSFIQVITGIKQTSTWENWLKPHKNELKKEIETAINSII